MSTSLQERLKQTALTVAETSGLRGVARIDFLSDGGELVINEVNTIPGSLAKYLWVDPIVPFPTLLQDLLDEAWNRPTLRLTSAGADGSVLKGASSIAAKLV
jgi:D-alanine-D-alanine ligase